MDGSRECNKLSGSQASPSSQTVLTSVKYAQERDFDSTGLCIGKNYSESPVLGTILLRSVDASDLEFKKQHCCSGDVL